ncbi:hypothetical protein HXZ79_08125 [Acinetobacter indicus]|uniref:hypothetical protein n=1 Tax=Acinetobacter indicus TaxID=756892 RepID=UPI000CEBC520|nr:hypothetical protein [Acinetobacter indicus]MDM1311223.1 hypothetical protein [Acinetobacter indicus]
MALVIIEKLTSLQTTDGVVVAQKVVNLLPDGNLETYYFCYLIDNKNNIFIPDKVRFDLKKMEIEDIVLKVLENSLILNDMNANL